MTSRVQQEAWVHLLCSCGFSGGHHHVHQALDRHVSWGCQRCAGYLQLCNSRSYQQSLWGLSSPHQQGLSLLSCSWKCCRGPPSVRAHCVSWGCVTEATNPRRDLTILIGLKCTAMEVLTSPDHLPLSYLMGYNP